eukprot:TRINITY_DN7214_c0_g1_i4.p1 TRINITY_DN7214_c0_g1~~TRINITY_DN7214_c0_g1_i4.p1  ORF type:complete len:141 (+),score=8.13 TRINITY_DN7214_c0_g1_i4:93-515(+)
MGGNQSTEVAMKVWNELKTSSPNLRETALKLLPFCKDWKTFTSTIFTEEIRSFFTSNKKDYLSLTSQVLSCIIEGPSLFGCAGKRRVMCRGCVGSSAFAEQIVAADYGVVGQNSAAIFLGLQKCSHSRCTSLLHNNGIIF